MPSFSANPAKRKKIIHHDIHGKPREVIGADMFTLNNKYYLCIVDYQSKLPIVKRADNISAESLILACKVIFSEYGLPMRIMSDADGNFISDELRQFCKCMYIEQVASLSYHHQSNGQVDACIKFMKHIRKKCIETKYHIYIALLEIRATSLEPGLPSPAKLLFNYPIWGIMPIINRIPIVTQDD